MLEGYMAAKAIEKLFKFAVSRADADTLIKIGAKLGASKNTKTAEDIPSPPKTIEEAMLRNERMAPVAQKYLDANQIPWRERLPSMPQISDDSIMNDIGNAVSKKYDKVVASPLQNYFQKSFDFVPENVTKSLEDNQRHLNTAQRYKDISDRDMQNMTRTQLRALNLAFKNNASPAELDALTQGFRQQREQANTLDSSRASALESIVSPVDLAAQERRRRQLLRSLGY